MTKVLVIDDHLEIQKAIARRLAGRFDVTVKPHALDVVSDFESLGKPVVVLDVWMPEVDGITAASKLKEKHPEAPIIFISSDESPELVAKARALGAAAYVVKSRIATELVRAIEAVLEAQPEELDAPPNE